LSRFDQHSAYAFLIFYIIYIIWTSTLFIPPLLTSLIVFFGMFPDTDGFYFILKNKSPDKTAVELIDGDFQHHFHSRIHNPLNYLPLIILFIIALIFNFYPLYFLTPVIGIYSHFFFDSVASGDGIMWGNNPFRKKQYGRFINIFSKNTDGYHGYYWDARYRKTIICKIGNICVLISAIIIQIMAIHYAIFIGNYWSILYTSSVVYFIMIVILGTKKHPIKWIEEPPNGRYQDYRINPDYINGLSKRNKKRHLEKYSYLLNDVNSKLFI